MAVSPSPRRGEGSTARASRLLQLVFIATISTP